MSPRAGAVCPWARSLQQEVVLDRCAGHLMQCQSLRTPPALARAAADAYSLLYYMGAILGEGPATIVQWSIFPLMEAVAAAAMRYALWRAPIHRPTAAFRRTVAEVASVLTWHLPPPRSKVPWAAATMRTRASAFFR